MGEGNGAGGSRGVVNVRRSVTVLSVLAAGVLLAACSSGQNPKAVSVAHPVKPSSNHKRQVTTTTMTVVAPTSAPQTLPPLPPPSIVTTTTNPEIAVLQSKVSDEQSVVTRDTATLQGDQNKLESDTQWCNDPLDGGATGEIGLLPCSSQLQIDEGNVSADTQELSNAEATLGTDEQELSAAS